jgi:hypothetical protein
MWPFRAPSFVAWRRPAGPPAPALNMEGWLRRPLAPFRVALPRSVGCKRKSCPRRWTSGVLSVDRTRTEAQHKTASSLSRPRKPLADRASARASRRAHDPSSVSGPRRPHREGQVVARSPTPGVLGPRAPEDLSRCIERGPSTVLPCGSTATFSATPITGAPRRKADASRAGPPSAERPTFVESPLRPSAGSA